MQMVLICISLIHWRWSMLDSRNPRGPLPKSFVGQPSDGPIAISSPLKHVQHHSGGCWPTSVCEVHWGHISASVCRVPCSRAMVPLATSELCEPHISYVGYVCRLACVGALNHVPCTGHADPRCIHQLFPTSHVVAGPSEVAGGLRGPLLKSCGGVAIWWSYCDHWTI